MPTPEDVRAAREELAHWAHRTAKLREYIDARGTHPPPDQNTVPSSEPS